MRATPEPPQDRFCDLVMKGGITSGVVYPKAIALLARHYRFKSIGGTSAGAIAAAITATAEFRRRNIGTRDGFEALTKLPEELMEKRPERKRSRLLSLFQAPIAGIQLSIAPPASRREVTAVPFCAGPLYNAPQLARPQSAYRAWAGSPCPDKR